MNEMKRVFGVFLMYVLIFIVYLVMLGNPIFDCEKWNQISNVFALLIHLFAIFTTIGVTKDEFKNLNKRFLVRTIMGLLYLVLLFIIVNGQFLLLEC